MPRLTKFLLCVNSDEEATKLITSEEFKNDLREYWQEQAGNIF